MKKLYLIVLLALIITMICSFATAQQQLKQLWLVGTTYTDSSASGSLWSTSSAVAFMNTVDSMRAIDVSTVENKLFIPNKNAGGLTLIYVANALDGKTTGNGFAGTGSLDTAIIDNTTPAPATYTIDKVKVAGDGAIYACNLSISATQPIKIYRWASSVAVGTLAATVTGPLTAVGTRFGDGMGIAGSGTGTEIYIGGSASGSILKFTTVDGSNFTLTSVITTSSAGVGSNDISPVATNGNMWTAGASDTQPTQLVSQAPGANFGLSIDTINTAVVASSWNSAKSFTAYGHNYVLKTDGNIGGPFKGYVADVTSGGASAFIAATTAGFGANVNANATGGAARDANNNVYFVLTNNGYGKFTMPLSASPASVSTKPSAAGTVIAAVGDWPGISFAWTVSPGLGSLNTTSGSTVTYTPGLTGGTDTVTITDSASNTVKVIVSILPTSAPLVPEPPELQGITRSEPVWTFLE